jgi:hypothetical protein
MQHTIRSPWVTNYITEGATAEFQYTAVWPELWGGGVRVPLSQNDSRLPPSNQFIEHSQTVQPVLRTHCFYNY